MSDLINKRPIAKFTQQYPMFDVCTMCKKFSECKIKLEIGHIWEAEANIGNEKALCRKFEKMN